MDEWIIPNEISFYAVPTHQWLEVKEWADDLSAVWMVNDSRVVHYIGFINVDHEMLFKLRWVGDEIVRSGTFTLTVTNT